MGTKCCWKENKDTSENQKDVEVNKTDTKKKEAQKDNQKKNVIIKRKDIKRKSYPLLDKKSKEDVKKETVGDIPDKRSSTASFHSATSFNDTTQHPISNNNDIVDEKYQG